MTEPYHFALNFGVRRWVLDNSPDNPSNPNSPPKEVLFAPNSSDEMCGPSLGVLPVSLADEPLLQESRVRKMKENIAELTLGERSRFKWDDAFNELDDRK
jgi:hypothetical protein